MNIRSGFENIIDWLNGYIIYVLVAIIFVLVAVTGFQVYKAEAIAAQHQDTVENSDTSWKDMGTKNTTWGSTE